MPDSVPPSLTSNRSIELLRRQLGDLERISSLRSDDPEVRKWAATTEGVLDGAFGKPNGDRHQMTSRFVNAGSFPIQMRGYSGRGGTSDYVIQQQHKARMLERTAVLESCVEQLELLAPRSAIAEPTANSPRPIPGNAEMVVGQRRIETTVFISYRRKAGPWAQSIFQDLTQHGYDAFFDFQGIASGGFEEIIAENIRARAHFLVLLTPSALERCSDPEICFVARSKLQSTPSATSCQS